MVISVSSSIKIQVVSCLFSRLKFLFNTSPKERINHDILLLHHKGSLTQKSGEICQRLFNFLKLQCFLKSVELLSKIEQLSDFKTYFAINVIAISHFSWTFCI